MMRKYVLSLLIVCICLFNLTACQQNRTPALDSDLSDTAPATTAETTAKPTEEQAKTEITAAPTEGNKETAAPTEAAATKTTTKATQKTTAPQVSQKAQVTSTQKSVTAGCSTTAPAAKTSAANSRTTAATTKQPAASPSSDVRQQVWALVNQQRTQNGLSTLAYRSNLQAAADLRAREIIRQFSHTRPNGSSCFTAVTESGASYRAVGENIAAGYPNAESVMTGWMNSEGHRANILSGEFTGIAVGCVEQNGRQYWVQIFIA